MLAEMEVAVKLEKYDINSESPSVDEFLSLRSLIGWGEMDIDLASTSLKNSLFHVTVRESNRLIGMGRVVGDGAMYFYIQDVIVNPQYQNAGIGSVLMANIENYLSANAKKGATIGLLAAKGKEGFYSRYDYIERPNHSLGNGMCKFV